jgi:hypothetical protein
MRGTSVPLSDANVAARPMSTCEARLETPDGPEETGPDRGVGEGDGSGAPEIPW